MKKSTMVAAALAFAALAWPASAKTYYVKADGGNDANTGVSEAKAFKTIQKAIDKAAAGSTILVYPGTYAPIATNNKKLTIKAVEGSSQTSISGSRFDGEYEEVYDNDLGKWGTQKYYHSGHWETGRIYSGTTTLLSGFTIAGAKKGVGGGTLTYCVLSGNTPKSANLVFRSKLEDCLVTANDATSYYYPMIYETSLTRCDVVGNTVKWNLLDGGNGCTIANTLFADNETSENLIYGNTGSPINLYNCTISGNRVDSSAIYGPVNLYNCIVWKNRTFGGSRANFATTTDKVTGKEALIEFEPYSREETGWYYNKKGEDVYVPYVYTFAPRAAMVNCCVEDKAVQTSGSLKTQDWDWNKKKVVTKTVKYSASKNNISFDPCFIDPENGDYHLAPWSPCVDAGADYQSKTGKFDLDSAARKVGKVDIGAYELQPQTAVPADYDGDGVTDAAFFFAASGQWWIFQSSDGLRTVSLPDAYGTPCPADYDVVGHAEPAYFTAAAKTPEFVRIRSNGTAVRTTFGEKGATPVAAHLAAHATATFGTYTANAKKPAFSFTDKTTVPFGAKASQPVVADFDADGADDLGVYTPAASAPAFSVLQSSLGYSPAALFNGGPVALGPKGAIACCADYDGVGGADFGVYMSNTKEPYFQRLFSSSKFRETRTLPMGSKGDVPVVGIYEAGRPAAPAVWTGSVWWFVDSGWENRALSL